MALSRFSYMLSACLLYGGIACAQSDSTVEQHYDLETEVRFPQVGPKLKSYIKSYMHELAGNLIIDGYNVETMRNGEVVIVTFRSDELFYPNESRLLSTASKHLSKMTRYLNRPDMFRVLIAVHTDDTGSSLYKYDLSESRINSILDYYEDHTVDVDSIIGFAKGDEDPLLENSTRANRAKNRRVEFYIIPGEALLEAARRSK